MDEIHMIWVKSFLISFRHVQDGRTLISNTSTQFLNETFSYPCYGTKEKSAVDFTMCVYSLEKPALPLTLASDVARLALCFGTIHFIIWAASAAYFMLSLVRIWTTLRLAWPRTCAFIFHGAGLIAVFSFLSWDQFGKRIQENDVSFPLIPSTVILYWKILFLGMLIRPPVSHTITVMLHALDQIESALVKLQRNSCSSLPNSST